MDPLQPAKLFWVVKYVNVASFSVLVFDYFQTIEMEVDLIWKAKWGIGKILFLLARYPTFIDVSLILYYYLAPNISPRTCSIINNITSCSATFGIGIAEAILILRTYGLWNNRRILIFLLAVHVPVVVIVVFSLRSFRYGESPLPTILGCYITGGSRILFADFALLMANEAVVMILTLWIGVKRFRHARSRLVVTLYRDGILYFVYIFLISTGNVIVLAAGPPEISNLLDTFQRVMHSLLSARILLHVRDAAWDNPNQDSTLSTLHFN